MLSTRLLKLTIKKKKEWIGFYDKNGDKIYDGDLVYAYRKYSKSQGHKPKKAPEAIKIIFKVEWSERSPEYRFTEVEIVEEDRQWDEQYHYNMLPRFEAFPRSTFWKEKDGTRANPWLFDHIKHIHGPKKYKALYEAELVK